MKLYVFGVAPYVGAWIEIAISVASIGSIAVAPYVGAWIEISMGQVIPLASTRRSLRGGVD